MSLSSLHSWLLYQSSGKNLLALDESDRFGPYCVCFDVTGDLDHANMSYPEAVEWLCANSCMNHVEARRVIQEAVATWMVQRAERTWSLRSARESSCTTGACGQ
jgi:hypothetical protein